VSKRLGPYILLLGAALTAQGQVTTYRSEPEFLAALSRLGYASVREGFEEDADWGPARSPKTAPSITSQGIVWTSSHPGAVTTPSHITTGNGAARTGLWGLFSSPHGDPDIVSPTGFMRDGFIGTTAPGAARLYGLGGWFTGLFGGKILIVLDGDETRRAELGPLDNEHRFYGVIDTSGFARFEVREVEGTREDQKYVFADDFTFARQPAEPGSVVCVSAASFLAGLALAPGSIASVFGQGLAAGTERATALPLPARLVGTAVSIKDSAGAEHQAPLYFVSPNQINCLVPEGVHAGPATLTVIRGDQAAASGAFQVDLAAPGLFAANADGKGAAAALALKVTADGARTTEPTFQCGAGAGSCVAVPIDLGADTDQVFLLLFGTGIRGRSVLAAVNARAGDAPAEVLYAGPQGEFAGLDQVNVRLPRSLAGRGELDVVLAVDGKTANPVRIRVK